MKEAATAPEPGTGPVAQPMQISRRKFSAWIGLAVLLRHAARAADGKLLSFQQVVQITESHFLSDTAHRAGDLIARSQVAAVLQSLNLIGWRAPDEAKILADVLPDDHVLVRSLRSPAGRRFMGKVSSRELIYDRLDRISEVSGGSRLIEDIVKLPDGERYAKHRSGGGVPDLLDLLPKNASGKTRRIDNYDEPTGRIYTVRQLIDRLEKSYAMSKREQLRSDES